MRMNGDSAGKSCQKHVQNSNDKKNLKKKKSGGKATNASSSFALCTGWMAMAAEEGEPHSHPEHSWGGSLLQGQEPPMPEGSPTPGTTLGSVSAPNTTCHRIPSPLNFRWDAKHSLAPQGTPCSSLDCTGVRLFNAHSDKNTSFVNTALFFFLSFI